MVFLLYSSVPRILWLPFWVASFLSACARSTSFVSLVMLVVELFHLKSFPSLLQCSLLSIGRCVERRSARTWTSRLHIIPTPTFSKDLFEDISSNSSDKKKKASLTCYSLNYRTELPEYSVASIGVATFGCFRSQCLAYIHILLDSCRVARRYIAVGAEYVIAWW